MAAEVIGGMSRSGSRKQRLGFLYRISYRIRWIMLHLFGPAQLGGGNDPLTRLKREREERLSKQDRG